MRSIEKYSYYPYFRNLVYWHSIKIYFLHIHTFIYDCAGQLKFALNHHPKNYDAHHLKLVYIERTICVRQQKLSSGLMYSGMSFLMCTGFKIWRPVFFTTKTLLNFFLITWSPSLARIGASIFLYWKGPPAVRSPINFDLGSWYVRGVGWMNENSSTSLGHWRTRRIFWILTASSCSSGTTFAHITLGIKYCLSLIHISEPTRPY